MKALSLFSGIGGIDLAAEWAGIETVAFCERDPYCQKVLEKHWPGVPIYDDVRTLTRERLEADGIDCGTIELIHGGYPCQPFSVAGKREGEEDDRHLWPEVRRILETIRPRWFAGENVAGHVTLGLDTVLTDLGELRYTKQPFVIPACAVNAPHRRDRVFIVGYTERSGCSGESRGRTEPIIEDGYIELEKVTASNTSGIRQQRQRELIKSFDTETDRIWEASKSLDVRIRNQWAAEPDVGRVANGIPNRVDRLKSLGNAVVPQQIFPILAAIKQIDDQLKEG